MVPWCRGAVVPWCRGAVVPWCRGAVVPWCRGVMVKRADLQRRGYELDYCTYHNQNTIGEEGSGTTRGCRESLVTE